MGQSQDTEVVRRHSSLLRSRNCQVVTCLVSKGPFLWHSLGQRRELACVSLGLSRSKQSHTTNPISCFKEWLQ